ncbi:MAG: right-handed parallel beta-helix repeat-containing protein, partial [Planctomycetota bacterium]
MLSPWLRPQATVLPVVSNAESALRAAVLAANALSFQTSASQPVVIEFASNLIGQTIALTQALPALVVDHVTMRVAGAGPTSRVVIDATNAATAFRLTSRHAVIQNVRFQNAGAPGSQLDVFTAIGTDDVLFANCDFDAATGNALWLVSALLTTVQDCNFRMGASGLVATGGTADLLVTRCTFVQNQQAMLLAIANRVQIRDCTFDGNGTATVLQPICADVTFGPGNIVRNSNVLASFVAAGAVGLNIQGNQFHDNVYPAVQLRDLCTVVTMTNNTLLRNGVPTSNYQLLINECVNLQISGLQCADGGAGIFAGDSRQLAITGSGTLPTAVTGNNGEGITLSGCVDIVVDQVTVSDNLKAISGSQIAILLSERVDVTGSNITAAPGPGANGVRIDASKHVRVGLGSSVLDHGTRGVLLSNATDVVLGNWLGAGASLSVRGPVPLQIVDCARVQVVGTVAAPCTLLAGTAPTGNVVSVTRCNAGIFGPSLIVDGRQTTVAGVQIVDCMNGRLDNVTMRGHTGWGMTAGGTPSLLVRNCEVDGGTGGPSASGEGMLLNPGCHGSQLFGNLVRRQQSSAFVVVDCNGVLLGPGNRAIDNGGDGFVVKDLGPGPPT